MFFAGFKYPELYLFSAGKSSQVIHEVWAWW